MDTITQLIASGKELFERFTLPGDPDWQGEAANIPDDAYPEEDGDGHAVAAADATDATVITPEKLSSAVLEGLTGVSMDWLSPVRPFFERLAALAMSKHVTDEDFAMALQQANAKLPELFDLLDTAALQDAFEESMKAAMAAGVRSTVMNHAQQ